MPGDTTVLVKPAFSSPNPSASFVAEHGQLSVKGTQLVDEQGRPIQLKGVSAFWINWEAGQKFVNRDCISCLVNDWGITVYRIAVGVEPQGAYSTNPEKLLNLTSAAIDACIDNGIYVIVDWHVHDALPYVEQETAFFRGISQAYGTCPNLIYEIWNEPVRHSWNMQIKPFAETMINQAIRPNDPDNIVIIGTPSWSQDVDASVRNPIDGRNLMYALHFYAGTHGQSLRRKADAALDLGLPIFVSEWGLSQSDGGSNGKIYPEAAETWLEWIDARGLSWVNWSIADKAESSAALIGGASTSGAWKEEDLTPSGRYIRAKLIQL